MKKNAAKKIQKQGCPRRYAKLIKTPVTYIVMKPIRISSTLLLAFACLIMGISFSSCGKKRNPEKNAPVSMAAIKTAHVQRIPVLLARNEAVGTPEEQEKVQQTFTELRLKIEADPADFRSQIQLAQLYMLEARATGEHGYYYPAALATIESILENKPPEAIVFSANSLKASVYLSLHQFRKAKDFAAYAVALNGYNALIYGSLVDAHVELGEYEEAVKMADKMVSIRPDLRSYARVSYLREIYGDMEGAIEAMERAVEAGYPGYEESAWCRLNLGMLYEKTGDLKRATQHFETILLERPNYPFALAALARIEQAQGNWKKAESLLDQAIAIIPEVSFYEQIAEVYYQTGRKAAGDKKVAEVLEMLADDESHGHVMNLEYAVVYRDLMEDYGKALEYVQKEYAQRPRNIDVNRVMAGIYYRMGDIEKARQHIDAAKVTGSGNVETLCIEGLISLREGKEQAGKALLKTAQAINPLQMHPFADEAQARLDS